MDVYNHSILTEDYPFKKVTAPRKQVLSSSVQRGDIFFTPSSETPDDIGHSAVFIGDLENIVHSYHTIRFRSASNEYLDDHFKSYAFKGADTYEYFRKRATGSTRFTLSLPVFNELELTVPPLPEQKKIASILNSVDEVIETTQKQIDKLQDLKKTTMNELLTKGIGHTEFKDSKLGRVPKSWETVNIEKLTTKVVDGPHCTPTYVESGIPFVTVRNITSGEVKFSNLKFITESDYEEFMRRGKPDLGDILYSKDGSIGYTAIVKTEKRFAYFVSVALLKIKHDLINSCFLNYTLQSEYIWKQTGLLTEGTGLKHMVLRSIKALKIILPDMTEQKEISRVLHSIDKTIGCFAEKLSQTQFLKKSLMQDLLTGKVRVKVN